MSWAGSVDTGGRNGYGGGAPGGDNQGGRLGREIDTQSRGYDTRSVSSDAVNASRAVSGFSDLAGKARSMFSRTADPTAQQATPRGRMVQASPTSLAQDLGPYSGMTPDEMTQSFQEAGLPNAIQSDSRPGMFANLGAAGLGLLGPGGAALGLGFNTLASANRAQNQLSGINDDLGTSLDDSFSNSFGQQARGALLGYGGGRAGGMAGSQLGGRLLGPAGGLLGGFLGSQLGRNFGRDIAFNGLAPGEAPDPNNVSGSYAGQALAESRQPVTQVNQSSSPNVTQVNRVGPPQQGTFTDYGSYARQFFA